MEIDAQIETDAISLVEIAAREVSHHLIQNSWVTLENQSTLFYGVVARPISIRYDSKLGQGFLKQSEVMISYYENKIMLDGDFMNLLSFLNAESYETRDQQRYLLFRQKTSEEVYQTKNSSADPKPEATEESVNPPKPVKKRVPGGRIYPC